MQMVAPAKCLMVFFLFFLNMLLFGQCVTCGNAAVDAGETNVNCPQDIAHAASCTSPCFQPVPFSFSSGVRISYDFTGTVVYGAGALPTGWAFAGAPTPTTAGALPAADTYGAKAGLVQPNCSGSCVATNGFCIGNLASNQAVGGGGTAGKLGANFDGRPNVAQNLSYAVLRGQSNPTLVSETFDFSGVDGFKLQFWLFPSETSCGQLNSWGSCVGNVAYLDFSSNGGTSWTQIMIMNLSSSNSDMCSNNSFNTLWLREGAWSRVCLTVFRSSITAGNFYTAATSASAASGIMVSSSYFTNTFKFRIRYSQTASCTSGITTTNPGRYLAIDYPVITSGNEMIPCGISFINMCGYGADNNDDGVGSSTLTTNTTVFGTVRRSVNQAERGVEIFTSQDNGFTAQNLTGSAFASNYDLCNAEGGDKQCIDWQSNNNFYTTVYECLTDWEAASGTGINVQYYKGTTPQSTGMTKVTTIGKTPTVGWRYSASRFVSCGSVSDINPGCNGYSFLSGSLPNQFARGFYSLAVNNIGEAWSFYGATSCSNYFNGPFFAPKTVADTATGTGGSYLVCDGSDNVVFSGLAKYCSTGTGFSGDATLVITGPNGFSETIVSGAVGTVPVTDTGEYIITPMTPSSPVQCMDCSQKTCLSVTPADLGKCLVLPVELVSFSVNCIPEGVELQWQTASEKGNAYFELEHSLDGFDFYPFMQVPAQNGNSTALQSYRSVDSKGYAVFKYYRLKQVDITGNVSYSPVKESDCLGHDASGIAVQVLPNPVSDKLIVYVNQKTDEQYLLSVRAITGKMVQQYVLAAGIEHNRFELDVSLLPRGMYHVLVENSRKEAVLKQKLLKR